MILHIIFSVLLVNGLSERNLRGLDGQLVDEQESQMEEVQEEQSNGPIKLTLIEMYTLDLTKLPQFQKISTQPIPDLFEDILLSNEQFNSISNLPE